MTRHEKWLLEQAISDDPTFGFLYDAFIHQREFTVAMGDVQKLVVVSEFKIKDAPAPQLYEIETAMRIVG